MTGSAAPRRVACYTSSPIGDDDARERQRVAVIAWATAHAGHVVGTFQDALATETDDVARRPGLLDLLAAVGRGEVDAVVVDRGERLASTTTSRCLLLHELHAAGIAVWTTAGEDLARPPDEGEAKGIRAVLAAAADFARLPAVAAVRQFRPLTGAARAHAEIQRMRAAGTSLTSLARRLNAMGLVDGAGAPWTRLSVLAVARTLPPLPGGD